MDGYKILTISGWTQPADALLGLVPNADTLDYAACDGFDAVASALPQSSYDLVIGWSLGGVIARQLMKNGRLHARGLVSIGSSFQFVRNHRLQLGMPTDTFEQFYTNYRDDTQRTIDRFQGLLAKGDVHFKRIMGSFKHHQHVLNTSYWLPWLDVLRSYTALDHDYSELPPTLIVHGEKDEVVRVEQAHQLHDALLNSQLSIWEECAHAPHLHDVERLRTRISKFAKEVAG